MFGKIFQNRSLTPPNDAPLNHWRPVKRGRGSALSCGILVQKWGFSYPKNWPAGWSIVQTTPLQWKPPFGTCNSAVVLTKWDINWEIHPTFQLSHGRLFLVCLGFFIILNQLSSHLDWIRQNKELSLFKTLARSPLQKKRKKRKLLRRISAWFKY